LRCHCHALSTIVFKSGNFGCQPSSRRIFSELAINTAGSPGAARRFDCWNRMSGNLSRDFDHLAHAEALPVAQVVDQRTGMFDRFF
jgi:hypothetical protein